MVTISKHDTYFVMSFKIEEMDFIKTPRLSESINEKLESINYPNIILDLENIYYIDSTGLSSLINISRKVKNKNSEMVMVCSSAKILQLFEIAKVDMFFKIFNTMEDAVNYVKTINAP